MRLLELMIQEPRGPTRLSQGANLNYQRIEPLLTLLVDRGLAATEVREGRPVYFATMKGKEIFMSWAKIFEELDLQ